MSTSHRFPSGPEPRHLLEVEDLTVTFDSGRITAAEHVSFAVGPRERVAIVGESGSGKSATCNAIGGYITDVGSQVAATRLDFDGVDLTKRRQARIPLKTDGISMMFQDAMTSLDPVWTIGQQLKSALKLPGAAGRREWKDQARHWLDAVGLTDSDRIMKSRPYELSGGMRQRVMLAIALCGRPKLLIADEPTSALDASLSQEMMELMVELTDEAGSSLLIISHDIRLCQEYADRMVVMLRGRVVDQVASREAAAASHPYTSGLLQCVPTLDNYDVDWLPTIEDFMPAEAHGDTREVERVV